MIRPLRTEYSLTLASPYLEHHIQPYAYEYPHQVKVNEVWHTEIAIKLGEWIRDYGGVESQDYLRGTMATFYFRDLAFAMMFIMHFNGLDSETLVSR